jgi:hypothetical protein
MPVTISGTSGITTPGASLSSGSITFADSTTLPSATFSPVFPITASVASSAMTVTLNQCALVFRSSTLTSGTTNTRTVSSPISVVIPSTATLGTVNATQSRIVVIAIDNAGTVELAVVNISGGNNLDETTLISTTTIAAASNSASTIYSTTGRSSVPFRVVGYVESTQTTAGTWATAPSTIQGYGGQALAAMSSLGYGQTWQNVTGSRAFSTTYYNSTGKPILINITVTTTGAVNTATVNGVTASQTYPSTNSWGTLAFIVPPNASYSVTSGSTLQLWSELR